MCNDIFKQLTEKVNIGKCQKLNSNHYLQQYLISAAVSTRCDDDCDASQYFHYRLYLLSTTNIKLVQMVISYESILQMI